MIIKDTPGYISAPNWSPNNDSGPPPRAKEPKPVRKVLPKSYAHRPDGKFDPRENPIRKDASSSVIRRNPAVNPMAGSSDNTPWSYTPSAGTTLEELIRKSPVNAATADLSERRAKSMHRHMKRGQWFNPNAGEEKGYSSESGNDLEDFDNSHYDSRMVPADKKLLADLAWKIKSIKNKSFTQGVHYPKAERIRKRSSRIRGEWKTPVYQHDVKPPWNTGVGLAFSRYNEMILTKLELQLSKLRERNAQTCALEDASKDTDGPMGQGRR
jgi:hypothetical protein